MRQRFEVQHLRALGRQRLQQTGFARAGGAANDLVAVARGELRQIGHQRRPEGLVAAIDQRHPEADLVQDQGQRAAALAAAPAIHQRLPVAGLAEHVALDVRGDVFGDQRRAELFGLELADLLVLRADDFSFVVMQAGPVHSAGEVVFGEFALASGINHVRKKAQFFECFRGGNAFNAHLTSFFNSAHTLASILACDSSLG